MNAIDILGGILGKRSGGGSRSGGGGLGGVLLDSILKGGRSGQSSGSSRSGGAIPRPQGGSVIRESRRGSSTEFDSLEDLLRHAQRGRQTRRRSPEPFPEPTPEIKRRQTEFTAEYEANPAPFNRKAEVLIRAMVNAAKSDGQIDKAEQDAILGQLDDVSQTEINFLREEFARPLDVREFVWSVPLGMERQVYAVSLMAIRLDENSEVSYLRDLGYGFRMTLDECNEVHREFGAPQLRG